MCFHQCMYLTYYKAYLLLKANLENKSFILCCLSSEDPFPFLFLDKPLALHPNFLVAEIQKYFIKGV